MPPHAHGSAAEEQRAHKHRYDWWWEYYVPDGNVYRWYCWGRAFRNGQWGTWWEVYCWSDRAVLAPLSEHFDGEGRGRRSDRWRWRPDGWQWGRVLDDSSPLAADTGGTN